MASNHARVRAQLRDEIVEVYRQSRTSAELAQVTAAAHLTENRVADVVFYQARHAHLIGYAEYAVRQPVFASSTPPQSPGMYEPVTAQTALNECCIHLLTAIGLEIMPPERAAQLRAAAPATVRHVPRPRGRPSCAASSEHD